MFGKRILITGSKGQLGSELQQLAYASDFEFIYTDIEELDLTNACYVDEFFNREKIDFCINCAGYTAVDKAESEPELAEKINTSAVKTLSQACGEHDATLIHISTDFVFDGRSSMPYTEEMDARPISTYGKTKLMGELEALKHNIRTLVIRTSWLYSSFGNNFVKNMIRLGQEKDRIRVVFDQVGTPTYCRDLAYAIIHILHSLVDGHNYPDSVRGVYHYSNEGVASWYDFALEIFKQKNMDVDVVPIRTEEYPTPAPRPSFSVMDKSHIKKVFGLDIPYWKDSLAECLKLIKI